MRNDKIGYVYILASTKNGTLYIGVTSNLVKRIFQHKNNQADGFTKQYSVHTLVYFETCDSMIAAISREKQLKGWRRKYKVDLIESINPMWRDLYLDII